MRNRWYSPRLRQFLSPDPAGYVDSHNAYAYVAFDPINGWDPYGLAASNRPLWANGPSSFLAWKGRGVGQAAEGAAKQFWNDARAVVNLAGRGTCGATGACNARRNLQIDEKFQLNNSKEQAGSALFTVGSLAAAPKAVSKVATTVAAKSDKVADAFQVARRSFDRADDFVQSVTAGTGTPIKKFLGDATSHVAAGSGAAFATAGMHVAEGKSSLQVAGNSAKAFLVTVAGSRTGNVAKSLVPTSIAGGPFLKRVVNAGGGTFGSIVTGLGLEKLGNTFDSFSEPASASPSDGVIGFVTGITGEAASSGSGGVSTMLWSASGAVLGDTLESAFSPGGSNAKRHPNQSRNK